MKTQIRLKTMATYSDPPTSKPVNSEPKHPSECLRLEAVTTSVNCDDLLDFTLALNHGQLDTMIIVTSHDDIKTQQVGHKYGAIVVQTDLFNKNNRVFNKGAAINAGMNRFQYHGWRAHLDCDIILPTDYRRMLFNHTTLDKACIYGADRTDVIGEREFQELRDNQFYTPQSAYNYRVSSHVNRPVSGRYVDKLNGYVPIGYHQLWHADSQQEYPWSLGTAGHDDVSFAMQWGQGHRRLLPTVMLYHLTTVQTQIGQNWEGRQTPRITNTEFNRSND